MRLYEILSPPRSLVVTARFRDTFNAFRQSYPRIDTTLREFVTFRLTHSSDQPFSGKDRPFSNALRGFRHVHLVHGRVILVYQINPSELRLFIVTDHDYGNLRRYLDTVSDFEPMRFNEPAKVLTYEQMGAISNMLFEFAAEDRNTLEQYSRGDLSELFEYTRLLIDDAWSNADKDRATLDAFGGKQKMLTFIQQVLKQTAPRD